jgi:polyisoprenoid-binding protein YceI
MIRRLAAALLALALAPAAAAAEVWRVEDDLSSLGFVLLVNGTETEGAFPAFEGRGRFDPDAPGDSTLELTVDVSAVDLGNPVASHFARSEDWFAAAAHPEATFRLDRVTPAEDGAWTAQGSLTVRGVTAEISAPLRLDLGPDRAHAVGATTIDRRVFGIGRGPSAAVVDVADEIRVTFDLVALSADAERREAAKDEATE